MTMNLVRCSHLLLERYFSHLLRCVSVCLTKKNDTFKGACCWDCIKWETTRDVRVEEDIELGKKKTRNAFGGSTETNSEFNSDFNSESKRV